MTNADLKRFYETNSTEEEKDFLRGGSNLIPKRIFTDDIEALSGDVIATLNCGDVVIKNTSTGSQHAYLVAYKKDNEMSLVYCDHENVEEVYYEKSTEGWSHVTTDTTHIG